MTIATDHHTREDRSYLCNSGINGRLIHLFDGKIAYKQELHKNCLYFDVIQKFEYITPNNIQTYYLPQHYTNSILRSQVNVSSIITKKEKALTN